MGVADTVREVSTPHRRGASGHRPTFQAASAPLTVSAPIPPRARDELRALVKLALPLALAQAGQALLGLVDTAVVGRAGAVQLAGTALGNAVGFTLRLLGLGTLMGGDPLISPALGHVARQ